MVHIDTSDDYDDNYDIEPESYELFHEYVNEDPEALEKQQWMDEEHQRIAEEQDD
jgi:hypothetical protein